MERRFSLSDAMILMVGLGVGLGLMKVADLDHELVRSWESLTRPGVDWSLGLLFEASLGYGLFLGLPLGAGLTPCCLYLQSKGRPGHAACLIATAVILPALAATAILVWLTGRPSNEYLAKYLVLTPLLGAAILSSWFTLRLVGAWSPEPSWRDRLGRFIGVAWIVLGALSGCLLLTQVG